MFEPPALPERIYGLAVADGRRSARPSETIRLCFRIRLAAREPVPAPKLMFQIPAGWTALDPIEVDLVPEAAIGPSGRTDRRDRAHFAAIRVRADVADEQTAASPFQAVLRLGPEVWGSNIVRLAVRGEALLDGPASGLRLEPSDVPDRIQARLVLVNQGDAVARAARVVVPAPPGFLAEDPAEELAVGDVPPGGTLECAFVFRATQPPAAEVRIEDARVLYDGGVARPVTREALVLGPQLGAPVVTLERTALRLDGTIRVANAGWVPAHAVPLRLVLPAGWRIVRGSVSAERAPIVLRAQGEALDATLPLVPARGAVEVRWLACAARARAAGWVRVTCAERDGGAAIPAANRRSLHLEVRSATAWAGAGDTVVLHAHLWNDGDTDETIVLAADGGEPARLDLRAGAAGGTMLAATVSLDALPDAPLRVGVAASAADGTILATAELELRVTTPSRRESGAEPDAGPPPSVIDAAWDLPAEIAAGARLDVTLRLRAAGNVATLRLRPVVPEGASYVAGSTRVNGHAVVDGHDGPPLLRPDGLALHDVPALTELVVGWALVASGAGTLPFAAALEVDGTPMETPSAGVAVAASPTFALRPDDLPFHVDAPTLQAVAFAPPVAIEPRSPEIAFGLRLDEARCSAILRMLQSARGRGIVGHLPLLSAVFPDIAGGEDPLLAAALAAAGEAIRNVYERLFVKVRIPNYDLTSYDLEDGAVRGTLAVLLDEAAAARAATIARADLRVTLDRDVLRTARERLTDAPIGAVDAVATIAMLLPRCGDGVPAVALGDYVTLLADELATARTLSHDAFAGYLTTQGIDALDRARDRTIAVLEPVASLV